MYLTVQYKHEVESKLNEDVTVESIEKVKPDAVIIAAGATPIIPRIPGATGINVATAIDVLTGRKDTGRNVIIIGGGAIGCETAEFLIKKGKNVTILEMLNRMGNDFEELPLGYYVEAERDANQDGDQCRSGGDNRKGCAGES